jgi:hypothetical protein
MYIINLLWGISKTESHRVAAEHGIGFVLGVVVWIVEVIFIKTNGTRMTQIARIRADLGF